MKRYFPSVFLWILCLLAGSVMATDYLPLSAIHPGMKGTGKTCVQGRDLQEFQFEVLGLLDNVSVGGTVVLVRISGWRFDDTGIFAGMSGSPVYIDGKLLGAVAFAFPFSKEAIAGVTPFVEMKQVLDSDGSPTAGGKTARSPIRTSGGAIDLRPMLRCLSSGKAGEYPFLPLHPDQEAENGDALRPIDSPLMIGGSSSRAIQAFRDGFRSLGFLPVQSGAAREAASDVTTAKPELRPGGGIVANLIEGDVNVGAGGTITDVEGDRVYAFGHPFMGSGTTSLSMHDSGTVTVLPNYNNSFKFYTTGARVGTFIQDRSTGVLGHIGQDPRMLPVDMTLVDSRDITRHYSFSVARDQLLSGFLINFGLFSLLTRQERSLGYVTIQVDAVLTLKNGDTIPLRNVFSHPTNAPTQAVQYISMPVQYLLMSGFADIEPERLAVTFKVSERESKADIDSVWVEKDRVRPGETVHFGLRLLREDGRLQTESFSLTIPDDITPGPVYVYVGDGDTLSQLDQELEPGRFMIYNAAQLVRALKQLRQDGTIYVKMYRQGAGVYSMGNLMPALPPSYLNIFGGDRVKGTNLPLKYIHYMEQSLGDKDFQVQGSKSFQLTVEPY